MTDNGKVRPHFLNDRRHRTLVHIHQHELELPVGLPGQSLQAFAQTLRAPHRAYDDRDGGIQSCALLAGTRHGDDKFSVFLGNEILRGIGRAAIVVFLFNHDHKLLGRFEIKANLSAGTILGFGRLFYVIRCQIHQVDLGNFVAFSVRLHHVKAENHRIGAGGVEARLQCCRVRLFKRGFVFFDEDLFLFWRCVCGNAENEQQRENCDEWFHKFPAIRR